ncbi:unnamed protein product [Linum tenue]|uniref:TIR domain-containing protein n=1 Tax=Linum tenue TaxID=586396 RepID=A0AAV0II29_9ROSI|nr:unnamed protein product [Linum tenue]
MWLLLLLLGYVTLLYFLIRPRPLPRIPDDDSSSPSSSSSSELVSSASSNDRAAGGDPQILQPTKYDVFISFRGEDVRDNFLSIVFHHLNDLKKLAVYKDDVNLHRGVEISPSLLQAIEVSDVYVVILSRNYANSKWCLEELEKIFQCVERHKRMLIPVTYGMSFNDFYETLPSFSSSSAAAARYLQSCGDKLLEGWWGKLIQMLGVDFTVIRPEMVLIKEIIKAVFQAIRDSSELVKFSSYLSTRGWFGIESKVEQVEALLRSGEKANWTIGLWGAAGIGKTALAEAFFRRFSSRFEASYFFRNFADSLAASGPSLQPFGNLQSGFFSKLLGDDDAGGGGGTTLPYDLVLRRVGRIKALVVIDDVGDDVSHIGPLKDLLNGQYSDLFGPGSVVIVTSTNQQLLKNVCHTVHQVEGLADDEAERLFCFHAFKGEEDAPADHYLELVTRAVIYAGGNPQALTLLGAHLYGRDLEFWDRELGYLQNNDPKSVVENIGRRMYQGLSRAEKDLFLDLACFYPYWENKRLSRAGVLKDGRSNHITNLVDKSLIRIDDENCGIEVSLVLRDLGRGIVNEEGQIRKRTRLWKSEDVSLLFKKPKDDQPIEGIVLNDDWRPRSTRRPDIAVQADAFEEMENLRFLVLGSSTCNFILPEDGLNSLPTMLRILEWDSFPSKFLPPKFSAENLVTLSLTHSKIEQLWKGDELNVDLGNLKTLNLEGSKNLRNLPDLSTAKRLEGIHLCLCESLLELPTSVLGLPKLETLDLSECSSLKWENLEDYLNDIREQSNRPSEFLSSLKYFILTQTPIQMVPSFATDLSIQALDCAACTELTEFVVIPSLERLDLTNSLIEEVVELDKLTKLKYLNLSQNEQLILLSCDFSKLSSLERITLERCSKLSRLPDSIGTLVNLVSLDLSYVAMEELPSSIGDLKGLSELLLTGCKSLSCLPDTTHKLSNLETLRVNLCNQLGHLPLLPSSLKELDAHGCKSLRTLSTDIVAQAQLTLSVSEFTRWCFGWCWKLDPAVCSKIVDKFTEDLVRCPKSSVLLVPAKRVADTSNSEAGSIMGSHNNNVGNNSSATAKLRGQPWKLLSIIFCVLIETPPFENLETSYLECLLNSDDNDVSAEMKRNTIYWLPERKYEAEEEDKEEENLSKGRHLFLWSAYRYSDMVEAVQRVAEKAVDADGATVEFSFQGRYCGQEEGLETSILIKNCRVIPVYDDRVVTYEEEEDDGDGDQYRVLNLGGLYDQLCSGQ